MATLYLTEQGSVVKKKSRRLVVAKKEEILAEVPTFNLERVIIYGNVQITTQTLNFLLESGIETSFMSTHGKFHGRLAPMESKNILLRIAQYERYLDEEFQVNHSKRIVEAKIKNGRTIIQRYISNHPEVDFGNVVEELAQSLKSLQNKERVSTILGVEGQSTANYFQAFGKMFRGDLKFAGRCRRPPKDPINALLSFGYMLITNEILSILCAIGFDPYIGYLHGIDYGRPSLALDLVEEFRHPVVDRFTLNLINNHILSEDDFENKGEEGIYLKKEALTKYFAQYEQMITHSFTDFSSNEKINYRLLFKNQAYKLAKTIQTKEPYQPFLVR
ncbi:MAG: CRISPR-associated endonuclease Cas1 [bacterium]